MFLACIKVMRGKLQRFYFYFPKGRLEKRKQKTFMTEMY